MERGEAAERGVKYRVANGEVIPNEGEKRLKGFSEDYSAMGLTVQITDVTKPLLAVREMLKAGQKVVFDKGGSYAENKVIGKRQYFKDKAGSYILEMWLHNSEEETSNEKGCACCTSKDDEAAWLRAQSS